MTRHSVALDHVRALAALLVFAWHFMHGHKGAPVVFEGAPAVFPLALFDEGHTGVSLFMVLSGYLFAKILDRRRLDYSAFLTSRAIRLLPMLAVAVLAAETFYSLTEGRTAEYASAYAHVTAGFVGIGGPLGDGLWSVVVETHFYIILPALLVITRRWKWGLLAIIPLMLALRAYWYVENGAIQQTAYFTLIGRFDQFALGMTAFAYRDMMHRKHATALLVAGVFCGFYAWFDQLGGWYGEDESLWVVLPTIEGAAYATLIAYYERSFSLPDRGFSAFVGMIGRYSYSIYLLHFFIVFRMAELIDRHVMSLANFYVALAWSIAAFITLLPVGWLCNTYIEKPLLSRRRSYIRAISSDQVRSEPAQPTLLPPSRSG